MQLIRSTIVVVNDEPGYLTLMDALLHDAGYPTVIGVESPKAYDTIARAQPDIIILDIRLDQPAIGWRVLDLLRLDPATASIPVILCCTDARLCHEKRATLTEQRCIILEKPFFLSDLLATIGTALRWGRDNQIELPRLRARRAGTT
ncbi:MAG TPA: response regulator [Roseiflexaceae bacterium]|nr:response regulator [Roseiflexaceae bacterium]